MHCYTECHYAEWHYAECHYAECCYAERRYPECHYAECRGANSLASTGNDEISYFHHFLIQSHFGKHSNLFRSILREKRRK